MKNVVLCFDAAGETSASTVFGLLEQSADQVAWYHCDTAGRWQRDVLAAVRAAIGEGYGFLSDSWAQGDRIVVLGAGRGGYCAQALTRLLGTVGVLSPTWSDLVKFVLSAYALPRTPRTTGDWSRVRQLIGDLNGGIDIAVPVAFLGTWDATCAPGLPDPPAVAPANVTAARHALAIDGGPWHRQIVPVPSDGTDVVWFRGDHRDVAGGPGACEPLTGIAVDWVLAGALAAGVQLVGEARCPATFPGHADALAGSMHGLSWRRPPVGACVHASVEVYLQAHPEYWRRLPTSIVWADADWLARGERLVVAAPAAPPVPETDAELEAVAS